MKLKQNQDLQKEQIRIIKVKQRKTSKEVAEEIGVNLSSFNCWLNTGFTFGDEKYSLIVNYITNNKE